MMDYVPTNAARARGSEKGPRTAIIVAIATLAFVAGVVLMGYAMKHLPWFGNTVATVKKHPAAQVDPTDYSPPKRSTPVAKARRSAR